MAKRGGRPKRENKKPKAGKKGLPALSMGVASPFEPTLVDRKKRRKPTSSDDLV